MFLVIFSIFWCYDDKSLTFFSLIIGTNHVGTIINDVIYRTNGDVDAH